ARPLVLEVHRSRAALDLARKQERRQRRGNVVKDALTRLVRALDLFPAFAHAAGSTCLRNAEDMGVAADEFVVNAPRDRFEILAAPLTQQQREKVDLEQEVAELVGELRVVTADRRIRDLIGLLDGVRHDRALRLLSIPGAVTAEPLGQ